MSQTYDPLKPTSGTTTLGALYQIIRDHIAALVSSFSGTAFPSSPTAGQKCWRTDRKQMYVYTNDGTLGESGWVECAILSAGLGAELVNARGTKPTLDQRLDVALNEDGTLKASTTLNPSQWYLPSLTFTYVSTTSFKVNGDQTDIYKATRRLKINLTASVAYSEVVSASFASGPNETTVLILDAVLGATLVNVEHSLFLPTANNGALSPEMLNVLKLSGGNMTGAINEAKGADIVSTATINLDTATGNMPDITGTTGITAVTLSEGRTRWCRFTGILTITNGASLIVQGAANYTTAAGDMACFKGYTSGVVRVLLFKVDGTPIALAAASVVNATLAATAVTSNKISNGAIIGTKYSTTVTASGTQFIAATATWTPAAGLYQVTSDQTDIIFQLQISAVWYGAANTGKAEGMFLCDGSLMRFNNFSAAGRNIAWQQF